MFARSVPTLAAALLALQLAAGPAPEARAAEAPPTVVELFTSQGCNSCPPADAFLGELAKRDDVLALSLHIDYWDYLGWKDTFASGETTERQRAYGRSLRRKYVYTPQMVIDGIAEAVGSQRSRVESEIQRAKAKAGEAVPIGVDVGKDQVVVRVGADGAAKQAVVWLVRYDREQAVEIVRGENAGKKLTYYNVVRDITRIGEWSGGAVEIPLSVAWLREGGRDACAVLLQENGNGAILGVTRIALDEG